MCYLTSLDVSLPGMEPISEWELSQTCASRQLVDHGKEETPHWYS